jgi:hypothetical protein
MRRGMRLILDANEYIFGMDKGSQEFYSIELIQMIRELLWEISERKV